jgi:hypothetical protein
MSVFEWKNVCDEVPNDEYVLVVNDHGEMAVGSYEVKSDGPCWRIGHDCVGWDYDFNKDYEVTHWAKLPEAPTL